LLCVLCCVFYNPATTRISTTTKGATKAPSVWDEIDNVDVSDYLIRGGNRTDSEMPRDFVLSSEEQALVGAVRKSVGDAVGTVIILGESEPVIALALSHSQESMMCLPRGKSREGDGRAFFV
jgi:hypothetical protein